MEPAIERRRSDPWPEVMRLRGLVMTLTASNRDLSRALAELTDECPPWAPSLAIVYWLWSEARRAASDWRIVWNRIRPLIDDLGSLPAPKLTPLAWEQHRARRRLEPTKYGRPPCEATLNLELLFAKQMLAWGAQQGLIRRNPLATATKVKTLSQRETRLTPEDVERLLAAADDVVDRRLREGDDDGQRAAQLKAFILACFDSLLRFEEARGLRRDRIASDGTVRLLASETKSRRERVVRLTARTLEAVEKIKRDKIGRGISGAAAHISEQRVFTVGATTLREWFHRARELAGIQAAPRDRQAVPHDLRAGGATAADESGARPTAVQTVMGHQSFETTRRYIRSEPVLNAADVCAAIEKATRVGPKRAPRSRLRP